MARATGAALLVAAAAVFVLQVDVRGFGLPARSCGSAWDAVSGRSGWQRWWAADLADPAQGAQSPPLRTLRCPAAVNRRVIGSGVLAVGALVVTGAAAVAERRRRVRVATKDRLRQLGTALTIVGAAFAAGGLAGIALLTADPRSGLFLYVSRPAVALAGLLLVLPAVVLAAVGRALVVLADERRSEDGRAAG